jgi:hypothetical protein
LGKHRPTDVEIEIDTLVPACNAEAKQSDSVKLSPAHTPLVKDWAGYDITANSTAAEEKKFGRNQKMQSPADKGICGTKLKV